MRKRDYDYDELIKKLGLDPSIEYVPNLEGTDVLRCQGKPIPADSFENEPSARMYEITKKERKNIKEYAKKMDLDWLNDD